MLTSLSKESCEWINGLFTVWSRSQTIDVYKYCSISTQANLNLDQEAA